MQLRLLVTTAAILMASSATNLSAQTAIGTIEGAIDGEAAVWQTLDVPSEGTATAEIRDFGPVTIVSIQGHREGESIMRHVLSLEFSIMNDELMDPTVSYFPDGMSNFYIDDHDDAETVIDVTRLDLGDDGGSAEGTFSARLCRQEGIMSEIDLGDCRLIEGAFRTELRAAD